MPMSDDNKSKIVRLLKGIETGDPESVSVVNEAVYVQHNPQTEEGRSGLAALFKQLAKTEPRVTIVRIFADGDFVFAHTEYDFATRNIGFEVFRFEAGRAVEHWDNIQRRAGPNASGHSMVDGATEVTHPELTENHRTLVNHYVNSVLIDKQPGIDDYLAVASYTEHDPDRADDWMQQSVNEPVYDYRKCHRVLAEGNFVLSLSEGRLEGQACAFFDLFRLYEGLIVEHWNTKELIPPPSLWKNQNGKF